jgi:hypothetical protein
MKKMWRAPGRFNMVFEMCVASRAAEQGGQIGLKTVQKRWLGRLKDERYDVSC